MSTSRDDQESIGNKRRVRWGARGIGLMVGAALGLGLWLVPRGEALTVPVSGAVALPSDLDLRLPFEAGETCRITGAYNGAGSSLHVDTNETWKANEYYALDFVLPAYANNGVGQPVLAATPGTVVLAGWATAGWANYGLRVSVEYTHSDGHTYTSNYCHLNAVYVTVGQQVSQGEALGELGDSCDGDNQVLSCPHFGAHLHFSLHRDSNIGGTGTGGSYGGNAVVPEPFSGYEDLGIGLDLISDNSGLPPQPCHEIQPVETILEDDGPCFRRLGPSQYWHDESAGHDGSCVWTYAIDEPQPDNYVYWDLHFAQAGDYDLAAYIPGPWGESTQAAYVVRADGAETTVTVSQAGSQNAWASLGTFHFAAGGDQWVKLADNTGEPYISATDNTMIAFDALRITPQTPCECQAGDPPETRACERCGTQTRQCDGCNWPDWSTVACEDQGPCEEGETEYDATLCSGDEVSLRTCGATCEWGAWSECASPPVDGGVGTDGGAGGDGGVGTDGDPDPGPGSSGGCGCAAPGPGAGAGGGGAGTRTGLGSGLPLLCALLGLAWLRRRRRRCQRCRQS